MATFDELVHQVRAELADDFRTRLRERLVAQPNEWLIDQLLAQATAAYVGQPPASTDEESEAERDARQHRIRALELDQSKVAEVVERYRALDRDCLEATGHLIDKPPPGGGQLIAPRHRSKQGEALLREAKDVLHALLFGDAELGVRLARVHRELLTITIPRTKLGAISFLMRAATEIGAQGTWRDPEERAHDALAANTLIQVEYGEVDGEVVGTAIAATLCLINALEINEQVLYARMENVEESTLLPSMPSRD